MKYIFLFISLFPFLTACNFQTETSTIPSNSNISTPTASATLPPPSFTPAPLSTLTAESPPTETSIPLPTFTPTFIPTRTPLPRPFELTVNLTSVSYPLPFAIVSETAFMIDDNRLAIMNISEPANPREIWQSESLGESVQGIGLNENYAYLISDNELLVLSVENLQNPRVIAAIPAPDGIPYLDFEEKLLYFVSVSTEGSQITTIDLSVPNAPNELGTAGLDWSQVFFPFTISQNHIFLIDNDHLEIVDISDPTLAVPVAQVSVPTNINSQAIVVDKTLYVGTHSGILIFDITNIGRPQPIGQYSNLQLNHISVEDSTGYLFSEVCGFEESDEGEIIGGCGRFIEIINFSTSSQAELEGLLRIGFENCQCFVESVNLYGHLIFFEAGENLYILDTSEFM